MPTREAEADDGARVREVVSSAMSSAYAISPEQIKAIVDEQFDDDAVEWKIEEEGSLLFVATATEEQAEDTGLDAGGVVGVVEASVDGDRGELRWLFVDPEHWGLGHGTALFEAVEEALDQRGARKLRGVTFAQNEQGQGFCEQFGFERIDEREAEIGGETFAAHVYARTSEEETESDADGTAAAGGDSGTKSREDDGAGEPSVEVPETIEADDGSTLYVARDDPLSGIEGPMYQTFEDEDREEAYSYFCGYCGSTDIAMDDMGRIECENCGNQHRPKEGYDASYL